VTRYRAIYLTARREIRERARSRAFVASTVIQVAVVLAIVAIAALTSGDEDTFTIGVAGAQDREIAEAAAVDVSAYGAELKIEPVAGEAAARAAVDGGELEGAVVGGTLITDHNPPETLVGLMQQAWSDVSARRILEAEGLSDARIGAALDPEPLALSETGGGESGAAGVAFVSSLLLYIAILTAGISVATGVTEEKATRVVELVLSAIRSAHLLAGKVLGIGLLSLLQVVAVVAAGLLAALPTGAIDLPDSIGSTAALIAVFFVLGYVLYACAFAISGAIVSRQEDVQSSSAPLTLVLVAGYLVAISVSDSPDSGLAVAATFVPFVAPMVVPSRAAHDALPAGELALSIALMIAATALLLWLAARIYDRAVLKTGAPLKLRQALRLAR